jgi:hypothetical protein
MSLPTMVRIGLFIASTGSAVAWAPPHGYRNGSQDQVNGGRSGTEPSATVLLHNADTQTLFSLTFKAELARQSGGQSVDGLWLRGRGQVFTTDGDLFARQARVDYYLPLPASGVQLRELTAKLQAVVRRCPDVDLAILTTPAADGTRKLSVISFDCRASAELTFNRAWQQFADDSRVIALLLDLFRGLTDKGGEPTADQGTCSPTFSECFTHAADAGRDTGIQSFHYSCSPETGEVTCMWTCKPSADGSGG